MRTARIAVLVAGLAVAAPAAADTTRWSQGVPEAKQAQANTLFDAGNQLFAQQAHAPALEKYRAAIAIWDHPLIRFNLAVTLIRLDRPLEAAEDLEQALRFAPQTWRPVHARDIAAAMVATALRSPPGTTVIESRQIERS